MINVVTSAIITIIEKTAGESIPRSKPMLRITNSTNPRLFIKIPKALASRLLMPIDRAASIAPSHFPATATAKIIAV